MIALFTHFSPSTPLRPFCFLFLITLFTFCTLRLLAYFILPSFSFLYPSSISLYSLWLKMPFSTSALSPSPLPSLLSFPYVLFLISSSISSLSSFFSFSSLYSSSLPFLPFFLLILPNLAFFLAAFLQKYASVKIFHLHILYLNISHLNIQNLWLCKASRFSWSV